MNQTSTDSLLITAIRTAFDAGIAILEIYNSHYETTFKSDQSPLTTADLHAHEVIFDRLKETGIPVLSEEGAEIPFETRKNWKTYWLVDPLDGTREFVKRNGEFTVNIALMVDDQPVAGAIYIPEKDILYFGSRELGSFRMGSGISKPALTADTFREFTSRCERLPLKESSGPLVLLASRSHLTAETREIIGKAEKQSSESLVVSVGSSIKFCKLAEGTADFYPRLGPTMEWDTAAGQAIAEATGMEVRVWPELAPMTYNKPSLLNPSFIAYNPDRIDTSVF